MEEKDKPTSKTGKDATTQPKFKLKVVEDDPATGKPVQKEIEVTAEEAVNLAQQGYRAVDKNKNFNTRVDAAADKKAKEIIESEVQIRAQELMEGLKEADPGTTKELEPLDPEDPDYLVKKVGRLESTVKNLKDGEKTRRKDERELGKTTQLYRLGVDRAVTNYGVDKDKLIGWVQETGVPPGKVESLAKLLTSLEKANVNVDELPKEEKEKLEKGITEKLNAPTKEVSGTIVSDEKEKKIPVTREELIDAALEKLDEIEESMG